MMRSPSQGHGLLQALLHIHVIGKSPSGGFATSLDKIVSTDCQCAGPDHVVYDQAMEDASGVGISHPQQADRQMVASLLMSSSVHRHQPNPWEFCTGSVLGILRTPNVWVRSPNAGTGWSWEKARFILSFYRQETGAHTNWGCNSWA